MSAPSRHRRRGQSLVEFALTIPVIILIIVGIFDLGRGVYAFNTLSEAARQGNRLAIVDQSGARVRAETIAFAPALGLTNANVEVCFKRADSLLRDCTAPAADQCASGSYQQAYCLAIVTARINFAPVTPIISAIVPAIQISSTSIGPIEYACPNPIRPTTCP